MQVWQKFKYKMNVQTNMNALIVKNHANLYGLSQKRHDRIEIFWEQSFFPESSNSSDKCTVEPENKLEANW